MQSETSLTKVLSGQKGSLENLEEASTSFKERVSSQEGWARHGGNRLTDEGNGQRD